MLLNDLYGLASHCPVATAQRPRARSRIISHTEPRVCRATRMALPEGPRPNRLRRSGTFLGRRLPTLRVPEAARRRFPLPAVPRGARCRARAEAPGRHRRRRRRRVRRAARARPQGQQSGLRRLPVNAEQFVMPSAYRKSVKTADLPAFVLGIAADSDFGHLFNSRRARRSTNPAASRSSCPCRPQRCRRRGGSIRRWG